VYLDQEAAERVRFEREATQADAQALQIQQARREALTVQQGEDHTSRGARKRVEDHRKIHKKAPTVMSEASKERRALQSAEVGKRREQRQREEQAVAKQHRKLDKEEANKASKRLDYLLKQSSIFEKLRGGTDMTPPTAASDKKDKDKQNEGVHHIHDKKKQDGEDVDEEEEPEENGENHVFLTQQPSSIKFGKMKPYQLEALNWMIHLAEKGLNGILADGKLWMWVGHHPEQRTVYSIAFSHSPISVTRDALFSKRNGFG
jgi:SNF2 family DNA or RNA helicase